MACTPTAKPEPPRSVIPPAPVRDLFVSHRSQPLHSRSPPSPVSVWAPVSLSDLKHASHGKETLELSTPAPKRAVRPIIDPDKDPNGKQWTLRTLGIDAPAEAGRDAEPSSKRPRR